ncbi:MAG TPA: hypothetical protein VNT20_18535 [Flavisolibacter sp.]|nr:hypothetical protein [Flavisolibacter sp.]
MPGYDQEVLVNNSRFDEQTLTELVNDFENVRKASISFIGSLSHAQLSFGGTVWKYELTVEAFLKATIGHELHHVKIIEEKYLA